MEFGFTPQQEALRNVIKEFAEKEERQRLLNLIEQANSIMELFQRNMEGRVQVL